MYFSLFTLKGILSWQHYQCWTFFVKACYLICRRSITSSQIQLAHELLMEFYGQVVTLYGNAWCTPNLHLHGHLKECIEDYGPVYSFWLFSFERFNAVLGSYHTNNRNISVQLMQHFTNGRRYSPYNWPREYVDEFLPVLENFRYDKGSLQQTTLETTLHGLHKRSDTVFALPPVNKDAFSVLELASLKDLFHSEVLMLHKKTKAIQLQKFTLGATDSRHSRSSIVLIQTAQQGTALAEIQYFAECKFKNSSTTSWVAAVKIYAEHPCKVWFGTPTEVWTITPTSLSFILVSEIRSRVVYSRSEVDFGSRIGKETVFIVVPVQV